MAIFSLNVLKIAIPRGIPPILRTASVAETLRPLVTDL